MKQDIGIGLLGLGVIGSGVANILLNKVDTLTEKVGAPLVLKKILVHDITKKRQVVTDTSLLTTNVEDVIDNPEVDIVIELIGGERPALDYIKQALANGKHVVTANKEVIAKYGYDLLALANKHRTYLRYEASVGSGIPLISSLQHDLAANEISTIYGILNGTTNYVLTKMSQEGLSFSAALQQAQNLGYAEANPSNDIQGTDAAYKLAILSSLAFHTIIDPKDIYCQGISHLEAQDFRYAKEFGYTIKLLAIAKRHGDSIEVRVHPSFIPQWSQLAKVDDVYNAVQIEGDLAGKLIFYGEGAGSLRASSAVIADVLAIAGNVRNMIGNVTEPQINQNLDVQAISELHTRYYFRLKVADRPGVLAQISKALGDNDISISSVIQKESDLTSQTAVLVIMTHRAQEKAVQKALADLHSLELVQEVSNFIRVEA